MALTLVLGNERLVLRVRCFGGRAGALRVDDPLEEEGGEEATWTVPLEEGIGIFLLGDDAEDGTFLARAATEGGWEVSFYDDDFHQLALQSASQSLEVLLKLEGAGAPVPSDPRTGAAASALEIAPGPALWVTVRTSL